MLPFRFNYGTIFKLKSINYFKLHFFALSNWSMKLSGWLKFLSGIAVWFDSIVSLNFLLNRRFTRRASIKTSHSSISSLPVKKWKILNLTQRKAWINLLEFDTVDWESMFFWGFKFPQHLKSARQINNRFDFRKKSFLNIIPTTKSIEYRKHMKRNKINKTSIDLWFNMYFIFHLSLYERFSSRLFFVFIHKTNERKLKYIVDNFSIKKSNRKYMKNSVWIHPK